MKGLNPRQKRFAEEYLKTNNATQAAIKAGYSEKYAANNTTKILNNTNVQKYIQQIDTKIAKNNIADIQEIQEFWTKVMRNVAEKTGDRLKASELLIRVSGNFQNKIEVTEKLENPMRCMTKAELLLIAGVENDS